MKASIHYILSAVVAVIMVSCGEPDYPEPTPSVATLSSKLTIVHALAGGPRVKVKVDNRFAAKDTLRYEKAADGKLYNTLTLSIPAGPNRNITIADYSAETNLITDRYAATSATNNTSFIILKDGKTAVTRVSDDLALPDPGFAKVRFLHFAPDAADLKVVNTADASTTFSARKFNDVKADFTRFSTLAAGTYNFEVKPVNPADSVVFTMSNVKFDSKSIYTIYAKGLKDGVGDQALTYGIIKH
jgi:hypothetical protein